jgi:hypothetical protein
MRSSGARAAVVSTAKQEAALLNGC